MLQTPIVLIDSDGQSLLSLLLSDDELVEVLGDLSGVWRRFADRLLCEHVLGGLLEEMCFIQAIAAVTVDISSGSCKCFLYFCILADNMFFDCFSEFFSSLVHPKTHVLSLAMASAASDNRRTDRRTGPPCLGEHSSDHFPLYLHCFHRFRYLPKTKKSIL